jgi:hypothetical protein
MPRVIGIDPGTVNIDICGLDDGRLFLDRTFPTAEALKTPTLLVELLESSGPLDLVAGPSGYGLPLTLAHDLTETDLRLACLAAEHEPGGIGGLRALIRLLARSTLPVVLTPGVIHFDSVPRHRKVNRIDMGTADKVCAVALALRQHAASYRAGSTNPPSSCSSSAAHSPPRLPFRTAASSMAWAGRPVRSVCVARAHSTARSRSLPAPYRSSCCSAAAPTRSPA